MNAKLVKLPVESIRFPSNATPLASSCPSRAAYVNRTGGTPSWLSRDGLGMVDDIRGIVYLANVGGVGATSL